MPVITPPSTAICARPIRCGSTDSPSACGSPTSGPQDLSSLPNAPPPSTPSTRGGTRPGTCGGSASTTAPRHWHRPDSRSPPNADSPAPRKISAPGSTSSLRRPHRAVAVYPVRQLHRPPARPTTPPRPPRPHQTPRRHRRAQPGHPTPGHGDRPVLRPHLGSRTRHPRPPPRTLRHPLATRRGPRPHRPVWQRRYQAARTQLTPGHALAPNQGFPGTPDWTGQWLYNQCSNYDELHPRQQSSSPASASPPKAPTSPKPPPSPPASPTPAPGLRSTATSQSPETPTTTATHWADGSAINANAPPADGFRKTVHTPSSPLTRGGTRPGTCAGSSPCP
jgi:hypothetical protein